MKLFSQGCPGRQRRPQRGHGVSTLCAAGIALTLALGACAQHGLDDVKPTATTAYHTAEPGAPTPESSPAAPPR